MPAALMYIYAYINTLHANYYYSIKMIISNNGDATLLAIKPIGYMVPFLEPAILDINEFNGEISPLAKVEFDENF